MNVKIVPMDASHLDGAAAVEQACFSRPWSREMLAEELYNDCAAYLAAEDAEGCVVGYAGLQVVLDEGYIDNIAVGEAFRGRGVGSSLLRELIAYAREKEMSFLTLEVRASNLGAQRLYRKHGFREAGLRPGFYSRPAEDAVIMTLDL